MSNDPCERCGKNPKASAFRVCFDCLDKGSPRGQSMREQRVGSDVPGSRKGDGEGIERFSFVGEPLTTARMEPSANGRYVDYTDHLAHLEAVEGERDEREDDLLRSRLMAEEDRDEFFAQRDSLRTALERATAALEVASERFWKFGYDGDGEATDEAVDRARTALSDQERSDG